MNLVSPWLDNGLPRCQRRVPLANVDTGRVANGGWARPGSHRSVGLTPVNLAGRVCVARKRKYGGIPFPSGTRWWRRRQRPTTTCPRGVCFLFFFQSILLRVGVRPQPTKQVPSFRDSSLFSSLLSQGTKEQEEELQPWAAATARSPRWRGRGTPRRTRAPKARLSPSIPPIPPPLLTNPIPIRSDSCPSISSLYLLAGSQLETNKKAMNIQVRTQSSPPLEPSRSVSLQSSCLLEIRGFPFPDSLGFQAAPSGFGATSGQPTTRRDSHPFPLLLLCSSLLQPVDSSGMVTVLLLLMILLLFCT